MTKFNQRFFARLDAAAERTGVPGLARGTQRRRHLRWPPVLALALAGSGMLLGLIRAEIAPLGFALIMAGFSIAVMLPLSGPLKPWGAPDRVDEFDRALRSRAFLAGFAATSVAAMAGIWLLFGLAMLQNWSKFALLDQLRALSFTLMVLYSAVPTLYASWTTQPMGEED
ncbi:hypothetical protein AB2M62_16035 [Sphingomonas sp. MMS12-HWE2-04]|uniref:hypothetical protein n=1 Tax=Sphingomonas sp. MMS12-HWE2-04 TaxID=3234199 RepID=UPI00384D5AAA